VEAAGLPAAEAAVHHQAVHHQVNLVEKGSHQVAENPDPAKDVIVHLSFNNLNLNSYGRS
jgi:hypothetical protein